MFEMIFAPQPPKELIESRAYGVSLEAAVTAWASGYSDGVRGEEYRIMEDAPDLQPMYKPGFDQGEGDREAFLALGHGTPDNSEGEEEHWHPSEWIPKRAKKLVSFLTYYQDATGSLAHLIVAGSAVMVAGSILKASGRRR